MVRTATFLTWEPEAYSWVTFANLSPGKHTVSWEWFEPSSKVYSKSEGLSLQGGSPNYTVWHSIKLSGFRESYVQDKLGDWQVKVYFDEALVLTEKFQVKKAPWAAVAKMTVAPGGQHTAVDTKNNLIYVANDVGEPPPLTIFNRTVESPNRVYVFDGNTYQLLRKLAYDYGTAEIPCNLRWTLIGKPDTIVVDQSSGFIYVGADGLYEITPRGGSLVCVPIGAGYSANIAINPANGYAYVQRQGTTAGGRVSVLGAGPILAGQAQHLDVPFPTGTGAMAVNPKTNRVYVVGEERVYVLDSKNNTIIATIPGVFATPDYTSIDVNPETNRVYVHRLSLSTTKLTVIDGTTNSVMTTVEVGGTYRVRVNPTTNRIFLSNVNGDDVHIYDGYTNMPIDRVGRSTLSPEGSTLLFGEQYAVNPVTNKIYVTSRGLVWEISDEPGPKGVVINEVELNPLQSRGAIANQWVELYDSGPAEVDLSGWTITPTGTDVRGAALGLTAHIPSGTKILPGGYYIIETPYVDYFGWLKGEEVLTLRDGKGRLVDWTPVLSDKKSGGSAETWQRSPNGKITRSAGDWVFSPGTLNGANQ